MRANIFIPISLILLGMVLPPAGWSQPAASATETGEESSGNQFNQRETPDERAARLLEDPLRGVVVNRTITVQGQEFYQYFSMRWAYIAGEATYTLSVHERPSARWGSEVWVEYRRDRVFHMFLPPIRSQTKEISQQAADMVLDRIEEMELERALFTSEDLGPEEM